MENFGIRKNEAKPKKTSKPLETRGAIYSQ